MEILGVYVKKGFTLVEIIIASLIMAVTIGGLFSVFVAGGRFVQRAQRRLRAFNVAQAEIEKRRKFVRIDTWDTADLRATGNWGAWTNGGVISLNKPIYHYRVQNDPNSNVPSTVSGNQRCRRMDIQVRWDEPN
ncbi:MAG: prepilin-type N-terminal cleavage/methylation domain-containing protein [Candidatus Omnitrophota bacterium]